MTGPEHYRAAEKYRDRASQAQNAAYDGTAPDGWEKAAYFNAAAQVHATLALAAASALSIAATRAPHTTDAGKDWREVLAPPEAAS